MGFLHEMCTKFELNSILFSIEMYIDRFIMHRVIGYWYTTSTIFFTILPIKYLRETDKSKSENNV